MQHEGQRNTQDNAMSWVNIIMQFIRQSAVTVDNDSKLLAVHIWISCSCLPLGSQCIPDLCWQDAAMQAHHIPTHHHKTHYDVPEPCTNLKRYPGVRVSRKTAGRLPAPSCQWAPPTGFTASTFGKSSSASVCTIGIASCSHSNTWRRQRGVDAIHASNRVTPRCLSPASRWLTRAPVT